MKRFHARVKVVQMLKEAELFVEEKDNPMTVPICSYVLFSQFCVRCEINLTSGNRAISLSRL